MSNHIVKLPDGHHVRFELEPMAPPAGVAVPMDYEVRAPGVVPFKVRFPNHLRDAKQILEEVYYQWASD